MHSRSGGSCLRGVESAIVLGVPSVIEMSVLGLFFTRYAIDREKHVSTTRRRSPLYMNHGSLTPETCIVFSLSRLLPRM